MRDMCNRCQSPTDKTRVGVGVALFVNAVCQSYFVSKTLHLYGLLNSFVKWFKCNVKVFTFTFLLLINRYLKFLRYNFSNMILMCNRARIVFEQMDVRKEKTGFFQAYLIVPFHSAQFYKKKTKTNKAFFLVMSGEKNKYGKLYL